MAQMYSKNEYLQRYCKFLEVGSLATAKYLRWGKFSFT